MNVIWISLDPTLGDGFGEVDFQPLPLGGKKKDPWSLICGLKTPTR